MIQDSADDVQNVQVFLGRGRGRGRGAVPETPSRLSSTKALKRFGSSTTMQSWRTQRFLCLASFNEVVSIPSAFFEAFRLPNRVCSCGVFHFWIDVTKKTGCAFLIFLTSSWHCQHRPSP